MILLPRSVRIYVATEPANLRKSFEGLSNEVRHVLAADPLSGHVFLFLNRRRTMVKMLLWTRGDEVRFDAPPLCANCATNVGIAALAQWELEDGES